MSAADLTLLEAREIAARIVGGELTVERVARAFLDRIAAQDQNIVVGGLLLASVIVPNAGDLYRRARARLRIAEARRNAAAVAQAEGR